MILTPDKLHALLDAIRVPIVHFSAQTLGLSSLSTEENNLLTSHGINVAEEYKLTDDPIMLSFQLGMLSQALGQTAAKNITFEQLKKYIETNQHIPLTQLEQATVESIKRQSLSDIRAHQGKIFQDINGVIGNHQTVERAQHEDFLRENIAQGLIDHHTARQIAKDLARLTGDWSRDFYKSVQYVCHTALNEGRLAMIQRREGNSGRVYFQVQKDACTTCVRLLLTAGEGSKPRIFRINDLLVNGTNIGKKQADWKATVSTIHPHSLIEGRTLVLTDNGWRSIKDIQIGDYVLTHKGRFKKVLSTLKNYVAGKEYRGQKVVIIKYYLKKKSKLEKLTTLKLTQEHKVLTNLGWIEAINLKIGVHKILKLMKPCTCGCGNYVDVIYHGNNTFSSKCKGRISAISNNSLGNYKFEEIEIKTLSYMTIDNSRRGSLQKIKLFDIEVEEDESFIARGIVIHNCRCLLTEYIEGEQWGGNKFTTIEQPIYHPRIDRKKVKIVFNNQEYLV